MIRFVVQSPFQTLSAIEARHVLGVAPSDSELVVIQPNEPRGRTQLEQIASATTWGRRVDIEERSNARSVVRRISAVRRLGRDPDVTAVALGEYRSPLMRHLAATAEPRGVDILLLDDGVGTLLVRDLRCGDAVDAPNYRQRAVTQAARTLVPLRRAELASLHFVTFYDLRVGPSDQVTTHDFDWTRGRTPDVAASDRPMFVGTSLVESGAIDDDWYLRHVISTCSAHRSVYVPHRRESEPKLEHIRSAGIEIATLGGPMEFALIESGWLPERIDGLFSTVLHTLPRLLDSTIRCTRPPHSAVRPEWTDRIASLYRSLGEHAPTVQVSDAER